MDKTNRRLGVGAGEKIGIGHRLQSKEIPHPKFGLTTAIKAQDSVAVVVEVIDYKAALVDLLRVDPVHGRQLKVAISIRDGEEWSEGLGLKNQQSLNPLLLDLNLTQMGNAKVPRLDVGMGGLAVQSGGQLSGAGGKINPLPEEGGTALVDLVTLQRVMVGEALQRQGPEGLEKQLCEAGLLGALHLMRGAGELKGLTTLGMASSGKNELIDRSSLQTPFQGHGAVHDADSWLGQPTRQLGSFGRRYHWGALWGCPAWLRRFNEGLSLPTSIFAAWARADWPRRFHLLLAGYLLLRVMAAVLFCSFADLAGDEAYYWDWGRSLDWSYYSKPPMIGWIMGAVGWLAGASALAVRLTAIMISTLGLVLLFELGKRLLSPRTGFYAALALILTPAQLGLSLFLTIDAPLLLFWTGALLCFWQALQSPQRALPWLALTLCLGLGLLSKQIMLVLPLLLIGFCAFFPQERWMLRRPAFWLSTLGSLGFLVPVLLWQQEHEWITLAHTAEHFHGSSSSLWSWLKRTADWPLIQLLIYTPGLGLAAVLGLWRMRSAMASRRQGARLLWVCSAPALVLFSLLALRQRINPNWPAVFWMPALVLAVGCLMGESGLPAMSEKLRRLTFSLLATAAVLAHLALIAVGATALSSHPKLSELVGWPSIARELATLQKQTPQGAKTKVLALGHRYLAAQLAFHLPDHPRCFRFEATGNISSQYEIWPGLEEHLGADVMIVGSKPVLPSVLIERFASVRPLGQVRHSQRSLFVFLGHDLKHWPTVGPRSSGLGMDQRLLQLVNGQWSHPLLDWLMPALSALEVWLSPLLLLALLVLWRQPRTWGPLLATMALALVLSDAVVGRSLKKWIGRERPRDHVEGLWVRDLGKEHQGPMRLFTKPVLTKSRVRQAKGEGRSTPSNHVMNLTAVTTLFFIHLPAMAPAAALLTAAVAYSRVYCAAHWPSDLPPSVLLGVLCALLATRLMKRFFTTSNSAPVGHGQKPQAPTGKS